MNVTVDELVLMLGTRDVEIYLLQKQLQAAQKQIASLKPQIPVMPDGVAQDESGSVVASVNGMNAPMNNGTKE
jgi:hypothetical protein